MMNLNDIEQLIDIVERSSLKELRYKTENEEICLIKADAALLATAVVAAAAAPADKAPQEGPLPGYKAVSVRSPYVGSICLKTKDGKPIVSEGDHVEAKQLLCKIEAMKMFSDIISPVKGTVRKILIQDGELAEYDSVLFEIEEDA